MQKINTVTDEHEQIQYGLAVFIVIDNGLSFIFYFKLRIIWADFQIGSILTPLK